MKFDLWSWCEGSLNGFKPSSNGEITASCPQCNKSQKFYVNCDEDSEKWGRWVCFACDDFRGLNPIRLVAFVEDITQQEARAFIFRQSVEMRRKHTPLSLLEKIKTIRDDGSELTVEGESSGPVDYDVPDGFKPVYDKGKWSVPRYMKARGFKRETLRDWGVGYCTTGLYQGRVIIPIVCPTGRSFTARDVTGDGEPKYLNPANADHSRLLFGWKSAPLAESFCLVEGPLDAMKMAQHGIPALGLGGKSLSDAQMALLRLRPDSVRVTVMLDPEEMTAPYDVAAQLAMTFPRVRIAKLPAGEDPGSSTREMAMEAVRMAERYTGSRMPKLGARMAGMREKLAKRWKD